MELLPLVCLCLLSCSGDAVRVVVKEGSDAVLPCLISSKDLTGKRFDWRKVESQKEVFMYDEGKNDANRGQDQQFKGRVSFFEDQLKNGNASIKIRNTKMNDSGIYSCDFPGLEPSQTFHIELVVGQVLRDRTGENIPGAAPEPCVRTLDHTKHWSVLQCEAHGNPLPTLKWEDSDNNTLPAEEPQISKREGRFYVTVKVTVTKNDDYRCVATQEKFSHQVTTVTYVYIQGAAPEPNIKTLDETKDWSLLQCEAHGDPLPTVEWKDSAGNTLPADSPQMSERGGRSYITVNVTVTKTDRYRCVATQEKFSHQIATVTYVHLPGLSAGVIIGFVVLSLLLVVAFVAVVLSFKNCIL